MYKYLNLVLILFVMSGVAALVLCFPLIMVGALAVGLFGFAGTQLWLGLFCFPALICWVLFQFKRSLENEVLFIEAVGDDHCLYSFIEPDFGLSGSRSFVVKHLVIEGLHGFEVLCDDVPVLGALLKPHRESLEVSWHVAASRYWATVVKRLNSWLSWQTVWALSTLTVVGACWRLLKFGTRFITIVWWSLLTVLCVWFNMTEEQHVAFFWGTLRLLVALVRIDDEVGWTLGAWIQWRLTHLAVQWSLLSVDISKSIQRHYSAKAAGNITRPIAVLREGVIRAVRFIDDVALPSFIRRGFSWEVSPDTILQSREIMRELGWPINVDPAPVDYDAEPLTKKWQDWVLMGSDMKTGIRNMKVYIDKDLDVLRAQATQYKRTEQYQSTANELESTSRYFKSPQYDYPDLTLDEVWVVLKDIFAHSRLTPFNKIIALWEKKYALGFWMRDPDRPNKKISRIKFLRQHGYSYFKALWAETFRWAPLIVPIAHVSVKGEPLPPSKWLEGKVRTIIGSPISQYILSTVWNYGPNHNFAWETTPIKIGMPLNGYWLGRLFARHARFDLHLQGDMTAFDSTVQGKVVELIKAIRKKGFEFHKDHKRICELIDINYEQVVNQVLGFTSTGNIFRKGTGLTTGHSSTSMDNSAALVILYLMAWKELTGLSAREFLQFNELSCFGDDHLLSFPSSRPLAWSRRNIEKTMAKWGLTNRCKHVPLNKAEFLSKQGRRPTAAERAEALELGVELPDFIVVHNKEKLLGKLTAPVKSLQATYRVKRLLSYLSLTAHHKDVYDEITRIIRGSKAMMATLRNEGLSIPSYRQILVNWYKRSGGQPVLSEDVESEEVFVNEGGVLSYGNTTVLDDILNTLSLLPDVLNPSTFNFGYMRVLQMRLGHLVTWPAELITLQHQVTGPGHLKHLLDRTPYRCLEASLLDFSVCRSNPTELFVRHWLFQLYWRWRPAAPASKTFSYWVSRIANLQFALNGRLHYETAPVGSTPDLLLVIAILGFVHLPDWFSFIRYIQLPDVSILIDLAYNRLMSFIWTSVPANYNEVAKLVRNTGLKETVLVEAPTGTGKSTSLIAYLKMVCGDIFPKIVVIEPRTLLVHGLVNYMTTTFGQGYSGSTTGLELDPTAKVWYVTCESFLGVIPRLPEGSLVVVDEAHLDEKGLLVVKELLAVMPYKVVFTTATPTAPIKTAVDYSIQVPIASIWEVTDQVIEGKIAEKYDRAYHEWCVDYIRTISRGEKVAVIVDTPEDAEWLSERVQLPSQVLSSRHEPRVDSTKVVYCCTSVVDVGVTIPGLTHIISPNWIYLGNGKRCALDEATLRQRRGRVGRTCNGMFILWKAQVEFDPPPVQTATSSDDFFNLLLRGVPATLLYRLDPGKLWQALGLIQPPPDEHKAAVLRVANVWFGNFKNAAMGVRFGGDGALPEVNLIATGGGNISSSLFQSLGDIASGIKAGLSEIWTSVGLPNNLVGNSEALARLYNASFPTIKPQNLLLRLKEDWVEGWSDAWNSKRHFVAEEYENLVELGKIAKILASL